MKKNKSTTGVPEVDRLICGVLDGDNIVWEMDSAAPIDKYVSCFLSACEQEGSPVVYVSFNRSPQTIVGKYVGLMSPNRFTLVDCFSSGKGNDDKMFLEFFKTPAGRTVHASIHLEDPSDPIKLQETLFQFSAGNRRKAKYIFDSLTGMLDLWGDEDKVIRFFGHFCPRLYDLKTIAYWLLEKGAHSNKFFAQVRHITQVVLEIAVSGGVNTLTVRKAANRCCSDVGVPRRFDVHEGGLVINPETREDRELGLLTRMSDVLGSALEPNSFFERIIEILASELGMVRGTIVLLDRISNKLKIAAAHGLSSAERIRGEYSIGEGVTGNVVKTGIPEVIPDISKDTRFLNRTVARKTDLTRPISFICVPLKVDDEIVGVLSVDRLFAVEATLEKDLRLLLIVASIISQVIKINRLVRIDKDAILVQDKEFIRELRNRYRLDNVIGHSRAIQEVLTTAAVAAKSNASILITGETGTGKELAASIVHYNSDRSNKPFVKINCGALPETLLESELFGHVKGAFTGSIRDRKGRFEMANGGTLFLDEIAEMSPLLQVKLLRVLQDMEFEQVGGIHTIHVNVRIITATNKDLVEEIREGRFRKDLYYRLNVIPIHLPPLRERREDIPLLVNHFMEKYNRKNKKNILKLSRDVLDLLLDYPWPGNVRELENCIERAVVMSPGDVLSPCLLPIEVLEHRKKGIKRQNALSSQLADISRITKQLCKNGGDLAQAREMITDTIENAIISQALQSGLSRRELARRLNISRVTLRKKISRHGLK